MKEKDTNQAVLNSQHAAVVAGKNNSLKITRRNILLACVVVVAVALGGYLVIRSGASGFFASTDPENGTLTANAHVITDSSASGNKAIQFTAPATPPPTGGGGGGGGTTTPPPTPPPSTACPAYPAHTDASCTGPAPGTTFSVVTGNPASNKTYDGVSFSGADTMTGSNMTFKNCLIPGGVVFTGDNLTIDHCDIGGGVSFSGTANVTFTYNNVHGWDDGIHITSDSGPASNIVVSYNYVHDPQPSCADHSDAMQLLGINGLTVTYNTLDLGPASKFSQCKDQPLNSAFQIEDTQGPDLNMNLSYNYLNGGGYTARFYQCSATKFNYNRFGRDDFYGPVAYQDKACLTEKIGNVRDDNGETIVF